MKTNSNVRRKKAVCFLCASFAFLTSISSALAADWWQSDGARNLWEGLSFKVAVFSAIFTILAGICAGVWAVAVWMRELRWKQADLARQLLDEIFDFSPSEDALDMVDGESEFKNADGEKLELSKADIKRALKVTTEGVKRVLLDGANEKEKRAEKHIRYCFDSLFYYLERLERSVRTKVVRFDDLVAPSGYYVTLMSEDKEVFEEYARFIGFDGAVAFMNRFPEWQNKITATSR